ncbi:MAG: nuclear transport factor 2 family protein [Verrucomicrobia bacterium]|nr:nuclear transport factor 2 family protein [Verrucomicrobiota bacterium]
MWQIVVANTKPEGSNGQGPAILQAALDALAEGDVDEAVDQFGDQFTFTDHAFGLKFKQKDRLYRYFVEIRKSFPESERTDHMRLSHGEVIFSQWRLTVTWKKPFLSGRFHKVKSEAHGISVVRVSDGRIVEWSEYYDQTRLRCYRLVG